MNKLFRYKYIVVFGKNAIHPLPKLQIFCTILYLLTFNTAGYGAATQILNDNFFPNPAELCLVKKEQLIGGNLVANPQFNFSGTATGGTGKARSRVVDNLPYLLTAYRLSDKYVIGLNFTPSGYGHLDWPKNSVVSYNSTLTHVLYYRGAGQLSYKINDSLSIGGGVNLEYNKLAELDFVIPGAGNQVNKVTGINYTTDFGLFYNINPKTSMSIVYYSPVNNKKGRGTSTLNEDVNPNLSLNFTEATLIYAGIRRVITEQWVLDGKVYWSDWTVQKNIYFINSTTGSYNIPTDWKQTWSYQLSTRFALNLRYAILGAILYETNPAPLSTNAIGYPLSSIGSASLGMDLNLVSNLSAQIMYGYGAFIPKSKIDSSSQGVGKISGNFNVVALQLTYRT